MTGRTQFAAAVDGKGRVLIPENERALLGIEPGASTVAVSVALSTDVLFTPIVTGDPDA